MVEIRNVSGQLGKSGQNVLRSVGEAEGTEIGNVRRKTNALVKVLRKKIATKMTVCGQLGPSGQLVLRSVGEVDGTDFVHVRRKTNALEIVLRKEVATKRAVSGQLGPSGPSGQLVVIKDTDIVQN